MNIYQIIKRPVITEKSNTSKEGFNQITFEVHPNANRVEIKEAVEKLFKVKVLRVNVINMEGKKKRVGRIMGKKQDWKKAMVKLAPGEKVDFFEGA